MDWQFIKELLHGIFLSFASIAFWIGFAPIIYFVWPSFEGKVNIRIKKIKPYVLHVLPWFILVSVILTSHSIYIKQQKKIDEYAQDIPKFELRLGNVWPMKNAKEANSFPMFIEMEIINRGSPSVIVGWRAELKLNSKIISSVFPTSMSEPSSSKLFKDEKLIAEFNKDNDLINKAIEEPLSKGARKAGWLRFDFTGITEEQLINAEKIIYVRDFLNHEHSLKFKEIPPVTKSYIPGAGAIPFKL